jgi:sugar phosphate isomerase/epimerase
MRLAVMDDVLAVDDVVPAASRVGVSGLELTVTREQLLASDGGGLARMGREAAAASLEIHALVLGEHNHGGIADADPDIARAAKEDVRKAVDWAAELGAAVILVPFFVRAELIGQDAFDRCADAFASLVPLAAGRNVSLCFEGLLTAREVRLLAERVGSPAFGCYFDLANPLRRGLDSPTEIRMLGELVRRVHVKDLRVQPGDVRPGLGRVDFAECARALGEIGYDGWLTLETPPAPPPLVARDLSFARSVFPGIESSPTWPRFAGMSHELAARSWEQLATELAELGLVSVQLGGEHLAECVADPGRAAPGRKLLDEAGLAIAGLAGYRNLAAPDPGVRAANIDFLARCLEVAPSLGTWVVATETGTRDPHGDWTDSPENWGDEAWALVDDALERLLPIAEEAGVILAVEASVKNVLRTQSQLLGVLDRFPTQHLQVVCDPYNYLSSHLLDARERETAELLTRFEDRFVIAHLKDVAPEGAEVATPELGTGVFAQRPYLEFLRDRRPDLDLVLEHLPPEHVVRVTETVRELAGPAGVSSAS